MQSDSLQTYYQDTLLHQKEHACTCIPYEHGDMLSTLVTAVNAHQILEVGTGTGYTTACLLSGNRNAHIETIDQDESHITIATATWRKLGMSTQVTPYIGKAEKILPELVDTFDLIFFDANVPQKKFIAEFERLLKKGGVLLTTNLFLRVPEGGKYLKELRTNPHWKTSIFSDTALSVRVG